ncbi:MAG: acyltransferase family protein [Cyanobacteriota bacterium]|nr:acyltransferase family protein [Cyanobacteriota bacterium]
MDGLRAVAVIAVLINHIDHHWLPGGFLGVDLFFVISGYVVTGSLLRRKEANWRQMLAGFYTRRFRRLIPALLRMVVLVTLFFSFFVPRGDDLYTPFIRTALTSLVGLSNVYLLKTGTSYFDANTQFNPFLHTWSPGVEEQFYLFWPILFILTGVGFQTSNKKALKSLLYLTLLLTAASFLFYLKLSSDVNSPAAFYLMPARFWELAAECLLYLSQELLGPGQYFERWFSHPPMEWGMFLLLIITFCLPLQQASLFKPLFVLATTILLAGLRSTSALGTCLSHPVSLAIGVSSYSLYLWHWPLIVLLRWTIGLNILLVLPLLAAIGCFTFISYNLEVKFRFGKTGSHPLVSPLVLYPLLSLLSGLFVVALGKLPGGFPYLGNHRINYDDYSNSKRITGTSVNTFNCFAEPTEASAASRLRPSCLAVTNPKRPTLFLEGDSHANAIIPLAGSLFHSGEFNVSVFAKGGCIMPGLEHWSNKRHLTSRYRMCGPHALEREKVILSQVKPGDQVMLVSFLSAYIEDDLSIQAFERSMSRLAEKLGSKGAGIIIFAPLPVFSDRVAVQSPLSTCFPTWVRPTWALPADCKSSTVKRAKSIADNQPILKLLRRLESKHRNIRVFDPLPYLCPPTETVCVSSRQGKIVFFDSNHLTNYGARFLTQPLVRFLHRSSAEPPVQL